MSYQKVLLHLENQLNNMGNNIHIVATGNTVNSNDIPGHISIEIETITIQDSFNELILPKPGPQNKSDLGTQTYTINRVRLSYSMIEDYSNNYPYSDSDLLHVIKNKELLFGYYQKL